MARRQQRPQNLGAAAISPRTGKPLRASIYSEGALPPRFCDLISQMELILGAPVWLLVQNTPREEAWAEISSPVYKGFQTEVGRQLLGDSVALLLESPGGIPGQAF